MTKLQETAKAKLDALGYLPMESDPKLLSICAAKVTETIRNETGCRDIPEGLMAAAADIAVGEFLAAKRTFAPQDLAMLDLSGGATSIQEGDLNVSFGGDGTCTDDERLESYISHLLSAGSSQYAAYRRIRW